MKLFVGNLPYKATENDIQAFFEEAGVHVDSVNILRDRFSGEARGFGFVEINDDALGNQAVQACNGRAMMGRALVEKRERSQGGGPGGNAGAGGGRGQRDFGGSKNRW
jgi:RNA recognition motif-containing protein